MRSEESSEEYFFLQSGWSRILLFTTTTMAKMRMWKMGCGSGFSLQSRKIPVSGPFLMQKTEDIAEQIGHNKFKSSEGWLEETA